MARSVVGVLLLVLLFGCSEDEGEELPRPLYLNRLPSDLVADALSDSPSAEYLAVRGRVQKKVPKERRAYTQSFGVAAGRGRALVDDVEIAGGRRQTASGLRIRIDELKEKDVSGAERTLDVLLVAMRRRAPQASSCAGLGTKAEDCVIALFLLEVQRCEAGVVLEAGTPRPDAGTDDAGASDAAVGGSNVEAGFSDASAAIDGAIVVDSSGDGAAAAPPAVSALSPATLTSGMASALVVSGSGFLTSAVVHVDGVALATTVQSGTAVQAELPASSTGIPSDLAVYVENTPGQASSRSNTLYLRVQPQPGAPVIHDYSPDNGVAGEKVLIIGNNFQDANLSVRDASGAVLTTGPIGSLSWPTVGTSQSLEVTLSASVRTGPLSVTTSLGQFRGKIFNVGQNLAKLPGVIATSSSEYNTTNWSRASGADNDLRSSFFTAVGDCASMTSCTLKPWFRITFPSAQAVQRIAMRGNREYASGYDFVRGTFTLLGAGDAVLWSGMYGLPEPDRDLDIVLPNVVPNAIAVQFDGTEDQSSEPGFSELEVFGP